LATEPDDGLTPGQTIRLNVSRNISLALTVQLLDGAAPVKKRLGYWKTNYRLQNRLADLRITGDEYRSRVSVEIAVSRELLQLKHGDSSGIQL
jgi:hypothetical protein